MTHIETKSRVGPDGILTLAIPVGMSDANREVKITVESAEATDLTPPIDPEHWRQIISETAGSISDPTFYRHEQGEYEERTEIFP